MKKYKGYLIDLDGTMYKGTEPILEAVRFVQQLKRNAIPYLFVTNNSSRTPKQVAEKLRSFDIPATEAQVITTSMSAANYVYEKNPNATVFIIGEDGLLEAFKEKGFAFAKEDAEFVITGMDRDISYEKLSIACLAVRNGATFISTNSDIAIPTERGLLPGSGSLTSVVTVSTQTNPIVIGKPQSIVIEDAMKVLGVSKEETLIVGDNYDTDILAGIHTGIDTLLVYTGVTTKETLEKYCVKPTYTVNSLEDWEI